MKRVIRYAFGTVISASIVAFGLWIWYQIFTVGGRPVWTYWEFYRENMQDLLLLTVSALAVFSIAQQMTQEKFSGQRRRFWVWALLFAIFAGLFALVHLAGNEPADTYPMYP